MKKTKSITRFFAIVMSACMMMGMAACSSSDSSSGTGSNTSETKAEVVQGEKEDFGYSKEQGIRIAVDEINDKGGVQFDLKFEDDAHDPEKAVTAYGSLKDWGMQVSLATVTSAPGAAVSANYQEDKIFAITPSGSSLAVIYEDPTNESDPYGNVFQMCFTDPNQGVASADYLAEHTDLGTKIAIIYKNDDNYSTGVYEKFKDEAAEKSLEVVYEGTFDASNQSDFSVQLGKAQAAGADLLFLPIYYEPASMILTQANQMGYAPTVFGIDGMDGILTLEGFDTSLAEGVYLLTPFSADAEDELTKSFVESYKAKTGDIPNQFAADAYDCVYALAQAIEAAGITSDMSEADICEALVKQFTSMTFNGLTGTDVTWNENGEVSKSPKAVIIQNGEYVGVEE